MESLEVRNFAGEVALIVDGARWELIVAEDSMGDGNAVIVFTKRRRLVDDTSTVRIGNVGIDQNPEGLVLELMERSEDELNGRASNTHLLGEVFE
jgi:hypothetical protein